MSRVGKLNLTANIPLLNQEGTTKLPGNSQLAIPAVPSSHAVPVYNQNLVLELLKGVLASGRLRSMQAVRRQGP